MDPNRNRSLPCWVANLWTPDVNVKAVLRWFSPDWCVIERERCLGAIGPIRIRVFEASPMTNRLRCAPSPTSNRRCGVGYALERCYTAIRHPGNLASVNPNSLRECRRRNNSNKHHYEHSNSYHKLNPISSIQAAHIAPFRRPNSGPAHQTTRQMSRNGSGGEITFR
jgi:hypothetical protein